MSADVQRLHRLIRATGSGPHSASLDLAHHLRTVLVSIHDPETARLVTPPGKPGRPPVLAGVTDGPNGRESSVTVYRDATFSKETRDMLDELRTYLHYEAAPSEYADAVIDVTDRWDANAATEFEDES